MKEAIRSNTSVPAGRAPRRLGRGCRQAIQMRKAIRACLAVGEAVVEAAKHLAAVSSAELACVFVLEKADRGSTVALPRSPSLSLALPRSRSRSASRSRSLSRSRSRSRSLPLPFPLLSKHLPLREDAAHLRVVLEVSEVLPDGREGQAAGVERRGVLWVVAGREEIRRGAVSKRSLGAASGALGAVSARSCLLAQPRLGGELDSLRVEGL